MSRPTPQCSTQGVGDVLVAPGQASLPGLGLDQLVDGNSRPMIATNRSARDGGWLVRVVRRLASAVGLAALCLASGAKADALSAGKRAFMRHDYVRAASCSWSKLSEGHRSPKPISANMYQYGLGVPQD